MRKAGFVDVHQRGSHLKLRHADGRRVIVPMHRVVAKGTLASILKQAQLDAATLRELL